MSLSELQINSTNLSDATWYEPVPTLCFRHLMKELSISYENYYFIDFGSGKGRALFLAADYPFSKVIGVEFSRELHAVCLRNIKTYRSARQRCFKIESVCSDVVNFVMPPVQSVYFFYSPFKASVFAKVIDNLMKSLQSYPRSVYLLFIGLIPEGIEVLMNSKLVCREIKLGLDYIRWEKKRGLILHSGIAED
jgi:SAM-dependent methyltransferase